MGNLKNGSQIKIIMFIFLFIYQNLAVDFDYLSNGDTWTDICKAGNQQSPIDIIDQDAICDNTMTITLQINPNNLDVSIQRIMKSLQSSGSFSNLYATDFQGEIVGYQATHMTIHSPAEHKIDSQQYQVEIQIHHELKEDFRAVQQRNQAIVSILFQVNDNSDKKSFFDKWSVGSIDKIFSFNLSDALSGFDPGSQYYAYEGSLTQPPCQEVVNWFIYKNPLDMSTDQLKSIQSNFQGDLNFANGNGNNRNIQNLNDRQVKKSNIQCEEQFIYFFTFFIIYIFLNFFVFKML